MEIRSFKDPIQAGESAATLITDRLRKDSRLLICAATGNSPTPVYQALVRNLKDDPVSALKLKVLKLDEWAGLDPNHPATCDYYLRQNLIEPLNLPEGAYHGFASNPADPDEECGRIKTWIESNGPIDVCILGLGLNGHLGLNEPGTDPLEGCHVSRLTESTLSHSMLEGLEIKPTYGLTLGLREILESRLILFLIFGKTKAPVLKRLLNTPPSPELPASWLKQHPNVLCITDPDALEPIQ